MGSEHVSRLIAGSLAGDQTAWKSLLGMLWDLADRQVRASPSMGQLRGLSDDRREIVSRVFARLRDEDFRSLRTFGDWLARNPDKTFTDWFSIVVANAIRDYIAQRIGSTGLKRFVDTLADSFEDSAESTRGARSPITDLVAARELIERAQDLLPGAQFEAVSHWLRGEDFEQIATTQQLAGPASARALVRAALARLRREVGAQ